MTLSHTPVRGTCMSTGVQWALTPEKLRAHTHTHTHTHAHTHTHRHMHTGTPLGKSELQTILSKYTGHWGKSGIGLW